ncbi:Tudor domain-containing protein 3 [Taenia solium]|eukprot:TsM_000652100 transcript=TsM_000652100 gene=TsM_000652100
MLAAGDKCCGTKSGDASPSFCFMENDVDEDLVVIVPSNSNWGRCCVSKDGVMELKSANCDSPSQCSKSLCECCTKVQVGNDDVVNGCGSNSNTGSSQGDDEDLCDRMKKLSTSDGLEKQSKLREEISDSVFLKWHVGDMCVCRWCMDNKWYFAEITNTDHSSSSCEVRFLYFGAKQGIYIGDLHPVDASSWKRVVDEDNILAAQAMLIIARIRSDVDKPQSDASGANTTKKNALQMGNIHVGELCICHFGRDAQFFFGKILAINVSERMCKVMLLLRGRQERCVPFENIYSCYSKVAEMVTDDANVMYMQRELVRQMRLPMLEPFLGTRAGKSDVKNGKLRGRVGMLRVRRIFARLRMNTLIDGVGEAFVYFTQHIHTQSMQKLLKEGLLKEILKPACYIPKSATFTGEKNFVMRRT